LRKFNRQQYSNKKTLTDYSNTY